MHSKRMNLSDSVRKTIANQLQSVLVHAIDLRMQTKQAHWNIQGPSFHPLHLLLDTFHLEHLEIVDETAERAVMLGVPADGRVGTVAKTSGLPAFPDGFVRDKEVVTLISDRIAATIAVVREGIEAVEEIDPVTQDMLNGFAHTLEKQLWFLQSHEL